MQLIRHLPAFLPSRWQLSEFWRASPHDSALQAHGVSRQRAKLYLWSVMLELHMSCDVGLPFHGWLLERSRGRWRQVSSGRENGCKRCLKPLNCCKFRRSNVHASQRVAGHCVIYVWMINGMLMETGERQAVFEATFSRMRLRAAKE